MSFDELKERVKQKLPMLSGLNAKVGFDFQEDGEFFVDATQNPAVISEGSGDADVTLSCSLDVFKGIMDGSQDPTMAYMMGKLKVKGSMGLAMKLNSILED